MINDKLRLVDGFRGLPGGVDGSQDPELTPATSVYHAENVIFRGGAGPRTRSGFTYVKLEGAGAFYGATNVQCAAVFEPPARDPVIVLVVDGTVLVVNVRTKICTRVTKTEDGKSLEQFTNKTKPCYACQVEEFLVIQDGSPYNDGWTNGPKILSFKSDGTPFLELTSKYCQGNKLTRMPSGAQMVYGQGRLFVASASGREIIAGDIAFGGSLQATSIVTSAPETVGRTKVTTAAAHDFIVGDYVTITGHSNPINSSFRVEAAPSKTEFSINATTTAEGAGGYATEFTAGKSSDALNFSETTFINEGGNLLIPLYMGPIKFLTFLPVQDVATGQGDLIAMGANGAVSFSVTVPRDKWKETVGFQRVLFSDIGSLSSSSVCINGDIYFRSRQGNGIRTYRSARSEFGGFGMAPISAELDRVFSQETISYLSQVSMIHFDDRLLITCDPVKTNNKLTYKGIIPLDFRPCSVNNGKTGAIYDGVWRGLLVVQLLKITLDSEDRAFAICYHDNLFQVWEITKDAYVDKNPQEKDSAIKSLVLTRGYEFESPFSEKKLLHGDLWFSDLGGVSTKKFEVDLKFRPDSNPNWTDWGNWNLCFTEGATGAARGYSELRAAVPPEGSNGFTKRLIGRGYDFKLRIAWRGRGKLEKLISHAVQTVEAVGASSVADSCIRVNHDSSTDTLDYKAWEFDGTITPYSILLLVGGTDFLITETNDLISGELEYISN